MSGMELLVSDSWGVYVPQRFAVTCGNWSGISAEDHEILLRGPDDEDSQNYWEVWDAILYAATYVDANQNVWSLHQDGDLWAICEALMTDEEYYGYFGEHREALDADDFSPPDDFDFDADSRFETDNWYDTSAELNS
jgi:hypothetical protein